MLKTVFQQVCNANMNVKMLCIDCFLYIGRIAVELKIPNCERNLLQVKLPFIKSEPFEQSELHSLILLD